MSKSAALPLVFTGYRVFDPDTQQWLERINPHHGRDTWTPDRSRARVYIHKGVPECIVTVKAIDMPRVFIEEVDCSYDMSGDIVPMDHIIEVGTGYLLEVN